jgi:hypothetical protein
MLLVWDWEMIGMFVTMIMVAMRPYCDEQPISANDFLLEECADDIE